MTSFLTRGVVIVAHFTPTPFLQGTSSGGPSSSKVRIGEGRIIGVNVIILPGVTVGEGCIIGAGSVVMKDIPPYSVAVGNPARVWKAIDEFVKGSVR